jgi:hypothetical protein
MRLETMPGQSLSEIVSTYVSEQCPLNTLMWASYQANPHAFYGSIHHLRADTLLELPPFPAPDESERLEANRQISIQREIFERYRRLVAQGIPKFRARQIASGSPASQEPPSALAKPQSAPGGGEQLKLAPVKPDAGSSVAGSEQALMNELALREAQARIQLLEQQLADLKRLLEEREQLQISAGATTREEGKGSKGANGGGVLASNSASSASGTTPPPSERVAPAWLKTTEGMVIAGLFIAALLAGFVLLWRMRTPITPAASSSDESWPPELRQARDAINRAAGRDAGLKEPSELEKAVGGRFPLPNLDFVDGVRNKSPSKRDEP